MSVYVKLSTLQSCIPQTSQVRVMFAESQHYHTFSIFWGQPLLKYVALYNGNAFFTKPFQYAKEGASGLLPAKQNGFTYIEQEKEI